MSSLRAISTILRDSTDNKTVRGSTSGNVDLDPCSKERVYVEFSYRQQLSNSSLLDSHLEWGPDPHSTPSTVSIEEAVNLYRFIPETKGDSVSVKLQIWNSPGGSEYFILFKLPPPAGSGF